MPNAEAPLIDFRARNIQMPNETDTTPTVRLSGSLFLSGGGLWYKGFAGTYSEVAVA